MLFGSCSVPQHPINQGEVQPGAVHHRRQPPPPDTPAARSCPDPRHRPVSWSLELGWSPQRRRGQRGDATAPPAPRSTEGTHQEPEGGPQTRVWGANGQPGGRGIRGAWRSSEAPGGFYVTVNCLPIKRLTEMYF